MLAYGCISPFRLTRRHMYNGPSLSDALCSELPALDDVISTWSANCPQVRVLLPWAESTQGATDNPKGTNEKIFTFARPIF